MNLSEERAVLSLRHYCIIINDDDDLSALYNTPMTSDTLIGKSVVQSSPSPYVCWLYVHISGTIERIFVSYARQYRALFLWC